jgi:hypothetical protein
VDPSSCSHRVLAVLPILSAFQDISGFLTEAAQSLFVLTAWLPMFCTYENRITSTIRVQNGWLSFKVRPRQPFHRFTSLASPIVRYLA